MRLLMKGKHFWLDVPVFDQAQCPKQNIAHDWMGQNRSSNPPGQFQRNPTEDPGDSSKTHHDFGMGNEYHWGMNIGLFANKAWYEQLANKLWLTLKTTIQIRSTSTIRALISRFRPTLQNISPGSSQIWLNRFEKCQHVTWNHHHPSPIHHPAESTSWGLHSCWMISSPNLRSLRVDAPRLLTNYPLVI
jgi:hypothetical protein